MVLGKRKSLGSLSPKTLWFFCTYYSQIHNCFIFQILQSLRLASHRYLPSSQLLLVWTISVEWIQPGTHGCRLIHLARYLLYKHLPFSFSFHDAQVTTEHINFISTAYSKMLLEQLITLLLAVKVMQANIFTFVNNIKTSLAVPDISVQTWPVRLSSC